MGTPANLEVLPGTARRSQATPADLVIAVEAQDGAAADALAAGRARAVLVRAGTERRGGAAAARDRWPPAARAIDSANVALISVPGEYAALEAHRALTAGLHVFLFSDHVPLEAEIELKRRGADLGLLVMGPECGTAMLGGVGLGFANVVRPGRVGIVAAAGTGAQESACLLDAAGVRRVPHRRGRRTRPLGRRRGGDVPFRDASVSGRPGDGHPPARVKVADTRRW